MTKMGVETISIANALFQTLFVISVIWFIIFRLKRRRLYKLAEEFDGPRPLPILGNILDCIAESTKYKQMLIQSTLRYKSPTRLWFGSHLVIFIWDPENIMTFLTSPQSLKTHPYIVGPVQLLFGSGLGILPVDVWKRHRRLIAPVFTTKQLQGFFDIFYKHSLDMVDRLDKKQNKAVFDIHEDLVKYSINSILHTLLGIDSAKNNTIDVKRFLECFETLLSSITVRITNFWYISDFIFKLSPYGRRMLRIKKEYDSTMDSIIGNWEESAKEPCIGDNYCSGTGADKLKSFMDILLSSQDGRKLTIEEIRGEISAFVSGSLDTIPIAFGYTLLALAIHPDIQESAYQEIKQVIGNKPRLECEDLRELHYLGRVMNEALRMYPKVVSIPRYTDQEINLKNHIIPANSTVVVGFSSVHRDPNIWPNPSLFDPDRFLPENEAKRHPYSYLPFSAGPRICIGMRFATMSLKVALSNILLKYELFTDYNDFDNIEVTTMTSFQPTRGFRIGVTLRE